MIKDTIKNIEDRFDSLVSHPVMKSAMVINPQNWPDGEALQDYGDEEVEQIYSAYKKPLEARHVDLNHCKVQWTELKNHISRKRRAEKETKQSTTQTITNFHEMWSSILLIVFTIFYNW